MIKIIVALLILGGVLSAAFLFYKFYAVKVFKLDMKKITPNISLVFITKNNQRLLEYSLRKLMELEDRVYEIIVLDLGSLDRTMEIAHKYLDETNKAKILDISRENIVTNYLNISSRFFSGDVLFLIDLYRLGAINPNVYIPDLFKPLKSMLKNGCPNPDTRIDGTKLLSINEVEREKNNYVLKEYITETLANIRMRMETCLERAKSNPATMEENFRNIFSYLDVSIRNISLLSCLMGSVSFTAKNLDDNLLTTFKDYSHSRKVSINYKIHGTPRDFKDEVSRLILQIAHDLLYTMINHNLSSDVNVTARYGKLRYRLLFKYDCSLDAQKLLSVDSGLSYYVLNSINNQLGLLGGTLRVKAGPHGTASILIQLPADNTTCIVNTEVSADEKTKK